jgi:hypothetical protein
LESVSFVAGSDFKGCESVSKIKGVQEVLLIFLKMETFTKPLNKSLKSDPVWHDSILAVIVYLLCKKYLDFDKMNDVCFVKSPMQPCDFVPENAGFLNFVTLIITSYDFELIAVLEMLNDREAYQCIHRLILVHFLSRYSGALV